MGCWKAVSVVLVALVILNGCAATPEAPPATGSVASRDAERLQDDEKLGKVWLAPGFDFSGYDTLYIADTRADVRKLNPDGVENLEWSKGVLRDELAAAIQARKVFGAVVTRASDVKPGGKTLTLDSTIIEYEKGGGGARFFAGLYGAGQPVIKVRGRMTDGDRLVFIFETRRSGASGRARFLGGYLSDKDIQAEDIRELAKDLADFIGRARRS